MPIRLKILLGCLLMTIVTVALGLFALRTEQRLGDLAIRTYDEAFMSMNFVRSAETKFQIMRGRYAAGALPVDADAGFAGVLEDLDIAIERATSEAARRSATALRARIADIAARASDVAGTAAGLGETAPAFDDEVELFAEDGFRYRERTGTLLEKSVRSTWVAIAASVLAAVVITFLLSAIIVPALRRTAAVALAIADGKLDNVIPPGRPRSRSETVILFGALNRMQTAIRENLAHIEEMRQAELDLRANADADRRSTLLMVADLVESESASAVSHVATTTAQMERTARTVLLSARKTANSVEEATAATDRALATARRVAAAAEQLAVSIRKITEDVTDLGRGSRRSVVVAKNVREVIETMVAQAKHIGDVSSLIGRIAERTNLLALNATIEAARAGEAGRGFAVVAGEVKSLAAQTASATKDISGELAAIMTATERAMEAVEFMDTETGEVDTLGNSIATAVQQQSAATNEIARSVAETASSVTLVAGRIATMTEEATATGAFMATVCSDGAALNEAVKALAELVIDVVRSSAQRA